MVLHKQIIKSLVGGLGMIMLTWVIGITLSSTIYSIDAQITPKTVEYYKKSFNSFLTTLEWKCWGGSFMRLALNENQRVGLTIIERFLDKNNNGTRATFIQEFGSEQDIQTINEIIKKIPENADDNVVAETVHPYNLEILGLDHTITRKQLAKIVNKKDNQQHVIEDEKYFKGILLGIFTMHMVQEMQRGKK